MKRCNTCLIEKDESMFNKQNNNPDGLRYACRSCSNEYNRQWRKTEGARLSKRMTEGKDRRKPRARWAVKRAEIRGDLIRSPCMICGSDSDIHAHHDNYDKPLDVVWLCRSHHNERHVSLAQ